MDRLKKNMLPFLILIFLMGLAIGFRSFLMVNIIEPVAYLCWAIWRAAASVNQNIYWGILIVICSILMIRLIPSEKDNAAGSAYHSYHYTYKSPNRVEYWNTLIQNAVLGKDEAEQLRENLKRLLESIIAQDGRSDPTELEKLIETGTVPLSRETRDFLFPPKGMSGISSLRQRLDITSFIPKRFHRWAGKFIRQDTVSMAEILERMEIEMEITHDK
jgi:hypothetical protein